MIFKRLFYYLYYKPRSKYYKAKAWVKFEISVHHLPAEIQQDYRGVLTRAKREMTREIEEQLYGGWLSIKREPNFDGLGLIVDDGVAVSNYGKIFRTNFDGTVEEDVTEEWLKKK